jgi:hypothetical protein
MGSNRVSVHGLKRLVPVYVNNLPIMSDEAMQRGRIAEALKDYIIREATVRSLSVNRNR